MLSQDSIDNLIGPFLLRQQDMSNYVVGVIAQRIKQFGGLTPSDVLKLQAMLRSGGDVKLINDYLATMSGRQVKEIQSIIESVCQAHYIDAKQLYDYTNTSYTPFKKNTALQRTMQAVSKVTVDTYKNLSNAGAFMYRDPRNPQKLIPTSISQTYYKAIDEAVQAASQGVLEYKTVMRKTLNDLASNGLQTVGYESEKGKRTHQRLDTAVRRNILDGIRDINQKTQDIIGEQVGATGKEITVHANSAPDHEPIQGHQFTNEEYEKLQTQQPFQDVNGIEFDAIDRPIGIWNCRHFTYSIIVGVSKPNFTLEQLDEYKQKNAQGYTTPSGRHFTMYECTQLQRKYELKIRKAKDLYLAAEKAGDKDLMDKAHAKVIQYTKEYRAFSKACGLKAKPDKTKVTGYKE